MPDADDKPNRPSTYDGLPPRGENLQLSYKLKHPKRKFTIELAIWLAMLLSFYLWKDAILERRKGALWALIAYAGWGFPLFRLYQWRRLGKNKIETRR